MAATRSIVLAIAATAATLGCVEILYPRGAVEFVPPVEYRALWRTIEWCSAKTADFSDVRWFSTPGAASPIDHDAVGSWWPESNRIYLNEAFLNHEGVVRHEMLHAIDQGQTHRPVFQQGCGDLVVCFASCIDQAGARPAGPSGGSPIIQPSQLVVSTQVLAARAGDGGYSVVIVRVTNPFSHAVWVNITGEATIEFTCQRGVQPCGSTQSLGPGVLGAFGANEMRQRAFIFGLLPGSYNIYTGYDTYLPDTSVLVVPDED